MRIFADTGGTTIAVSDLAPEAGQARGTICKNVVDPATHVAPVCDAMGGNQVCPDRFRCGGLTPA